VNDAEVKPGANGANGPDQGAPTEQGTAAELDEAAGVELLRRDFEQAKEDAARLKDQLLRTAADFDNFRKRSRKDVEDAQKKGMERALLELLPVSDNLERAIQAAGQSQEAGAVVEGIRMVLKLTEDALTRLGVERIQSVGQPFDPGLHEAVQQVESDAPAGTVIFEMVPGYRLGGKLLRAAMVAVARPKAKPASADAESVKD
jgi:molecular chaperone GrpE